MDVSSVSHSQDPIPLPDPRREGSYSLEELLTRRRSVRSFAPFPLTPMELSQLLWASQGITHPTGLRTTPSAGALYPLVLYVAAEDGVFCYDPHGHALRSVARRDRRALLARAAHEQEMLEQAAVVIGVSARLEGLRARYGLHAERFAALEAGHAVQNLLLQAVAIDLGAVPVASFFEEAARMLLGAAESELPLYLVPVGHPAALRDQ